MDEVWLCGNIVSPGMKEEIKLALKNDIPVFNKLNFTFNMEKIESFETKYPKPVIIPRQMKNSLTFGCGMNFNKDSMKDQFCYETINLNLLSRLLKS